MKLNLAFGFLCCVLKFSRCENILALALNRIIKDFYGNNSEPFDFIIYALKEEKKLKDLLSDALKLNGDFPYQVIQENDASDEIPIDRSAFLLFDNAKSYIDFHERVYLNNFYYKTFYFLVYILNIDETLRLNMFQSITRSGNKIFRFETFLIRENENSLKLITFETFQQQNCDSWQRSEVNQFDEHLKNWKNREIFIEKFFNFNGCEIVAAAVFPEEPSFDAKFDDEGKLKEVSGYEATINQLISKFLNYNLSFNPFNANTGQLYDETLQIDFVIRTGLVRLQDQNDLHMKLMTTQAFMVKNQIILITKSPRYSQFEKLFMPFELDVWIWLSATYVIAVFTITVLTFFSRRFQDFVFGSKVRTPIMNLM